ncbi:MAG: hypothetical protein R3E10_07620 [Gemmatimonadota bacterium]
MATKKDDAAGRASGKTRLRFEGLAAGEERPEVQVRAYDRAGKEIAAVTVGEDGTFTLPDAALKKAHRVRVGPVGDATPELNTASLTYRAADFRAVIDAGLLDIGRSVWEGWFHLWRCVSGRVSRCRRAQWWYDAVAVEAWRPLADAPQMLPLGGQAPRSRALASVAREATMARPPGVLDLDGLVALPWGCTPICLGTVEVYRRVCCCKPWVFKDPRLDHLLEELEELVREPPKGPGSPFPPGPWPGPDPAPFNATFLRDGALDERALHAAEDLIAIRRLPAERIPEYITARPYLLCPSYSCGTPVKLAEGSIGPDGRFNICWSEFPAVLVSGCHYEYAYKVKQRIGPFTITIYDGVAAGQWFGQHDDAHLKSYHPWAIACRDNGGPGDAFVYLDVIGHTGSHLLATPDQKAATAVQPLAANSGVAYPTGGPAGNGSHDRNWGGTLKMSIMFSESMRDIGAKYYRVSVREVNSNGDPVGSAEYYSDGLSWRKAVSTGGGGVDIVPVSLGPTSAGPVGSVQDNLYEIPFDGSLPLNSDWEADQTHVRLVTTDPAKDWSESTTPPVAGQPTKRHLVTIEVFNAAGERLRPNGTPATGLGGVEVQAAFTFRRKFQAIGPTNMVPFGALSHVFWWDNRAEVALIEDLRMNGVLSNEECQFLAGTSTSTFGIGYRAYHPYEMFQYYHKIWWKRGLSGGSDTMHTSSLNVGVPPAAAGASPTHTFGHMLDHPAPATPPLTKCAFSVFLTTYNKRTDGDDLWHHWDTDSAAFALDIAPECPPCECQNGGGGGDSNN